MATRWVTVDDGVRLRLWSAGRSQGPPVVLCHGGPGLWDDLGPLARFIEGRAMVQRYDQRGCGRSEGGAGPFTIERFVDDLGAVVEATAGSIGSSTNGGPRSVVVGHSWGASLALHHALAHPARCAGVVYVSGTGLGQGWRAVRQAQADRFLSAAQRRRREELGARARTWDEEVEWRTLLWAPDYADRASAFDLAAEDASSPIEINVACSRALDAELRRLDEGDLAERCRALRVPVLVLHGGRDPRPATALDSLVTALPRAEILVIPGAGHRPWVEAPAMFGRSLNTFLDRVLG